MQPLYDILARELERPRAVSEQVVKHLTGVHEVSREDIGDFLTGKLAQLEDYEIDLALAPLFTPTLADQAVVAGELEGQSVPVQTINDLIHQLELRPTVAQLVTSEGLAHVVPLREVTIGRFVRRLRLEGGLPDDLLAVLRGFPATERPLLLAVARRAVWEEARRREILVRFLATAGPTVGADVVMLLKLVETYAPADLAELSRQVPKWLDVLREELNRGSGVRPFFNERVEELHGGGRDQRRVNEPRQVARQSEWEFLERLQRQLGGSA